jgi:hypothetical protein
MSMTKIEFGNNFQLHPNGTRREQPTYRGAIELYPDFQEKGFCSLDVRGPGGAFRGSAVIDRGTARKLGVALLQWSMT